MLTVRDFFSGIGGFSLGFERAGAATICFHEIDKAACQVLARHWPNIPNHGDVRSIENVSANVFVGGDPCQVRSNASSIWKSKALDLSGYFLAAIDLSRPWWVVRENVPSPENEDFEAGLAAIGYRTAVIRADAAQFTRQQRVRDFVVGCDPDSPGNIDLFLSHFENGSLPVSPSLGTREVVPALTTHRTRYDSRDAYIFDERGFRILDRKEREGLAGFPVGWTDGLSEAACAKCCGNAVNPMVVEVIAKAICAATPNTKEGCFGEFPDLQ